MAYYDKIWCETPPLSFQTRHNPFEPIYLWQFLQCLIVTAVAYYVDIPRLRQPVPEKEFATMEEPVLSETTLKSGVSDEERKRTRLIQHRRAVATSLKGAETLMSNKKVGHHHHHRRTSVGQDRDSHSKKGHSQVDEPKRSRRHSIKDTETIDKKAQGLVRPKGKSKGQQSLLPHSGLHEIETIDVVQPPQVDTKSHKKAETTADDDLRKKSVIFNKAPIKQSVENDASEETDKTEPVSISKCFERLINEKLLPCLKREAGANLPVVPQPLPALVDMYDAFRGIKNRDILRGTEFVRSALPHLLFPNPKDAIWWHRCPESLSHSVDLNDLLEIFRNKFQNVEEEIVPEENWEEKLESEYLGTQAKNSETTLRILNLVQPEENSNPPPHHPHHHAPVPVASVHELPKIDDENQDTEMQKSDSVDEFSPLSDFVTEGHPFAEEELVPEPFLWADDYKCIPVHRKYQHFENINSRDVFTVLQQLYPRLCTGEHEKELHFELIFCDWLWCTSLLAKACTEREFRDAWKGSLERPITNPQSLGVYAHFVKQIKNNPYLNPPPGFKPKRKQREKSLKNNSLSSQPGNTGYAKPKKSILKGAPLNPYLGTDLDIEG
ncbi:hypothetical protein Ocin01_02004 [Orchesella cincta]|uniref:Uncharacterized protein n=1 Tax=Orchesella cincta TaxID=48709 RepID=A0A1D2NHY4_ORCCI|nr:hypothetical protein Ocin01_02004 [Orchesella cincta]